MKNLIIRPRLVSKPTNDAAEIGALYRRARGSMVEGVKYLLEAGARLHAKKSELPHGAWYPWLTANADVLGFKDPSIASRLMRAAKSCAGARFDDETKALEICRSIWGHTQMSDDETLRRSTTIRRQRYEDHHAAQAQKLLDISSGNSVLDVKRQYPVILADPPWQRNFSSSLNRSTENHYPTMPLEDIMALPVKDLSTDPAMLFLWTPSALLPHALQVIKAWGFAYKSNLVWDKGSIGIGLLLSEPA